MKNFLVKSKNAGLIALVMIITYGCLPKSDKYPFQDPELVKQEGKAISDNLAAYIGKWVKGEVGSAIPNELIPKGILDNKNFYLKDPALVKPEETWAWRYAKDVNTDSMLGGLPDPHVTYLLLATPLAPFGSKLVIEGEFPHARFFSIQVSPPLNGKEYYAQRYLGSAEVSMVDVDIEPLPGNTNPYKAGADRTAKNRRYRVEYDLAIGDPVALNGNNHLPLYRGTGNKRTGGLIVYQGPYGFKDLTGATMPGGGPWDVGNVWVRIYAPDKGKGPLGGVPMPKVWFELPTGEKYFIGSDAKRLLDRANMTMKARETKPSENWLGYSGPTEGWRKSWGIFLNILNGVSQVNRWYHPDTLKRIREIDLGAMGRGEFQPAPGNYEAHATINNYASYLGRAMTVEPGMVAVLTGKLPTVPNTRNGNSFMEKGQLRYWSIGTYDNDPFATIPGSAMSNIMDDEVVLDNERKYIIAYSAPGDKPNNANANNGVTWVNWGPTAELGFMMRYVSVGPDWTFEKAPHELNLTWANSEWTGSKYDSTLVGQNTHKGWMGCYVPRVSYMSRQDFEALGNSFSADDIPVWIDPRPEIGLSDAKNKPAFASSVSNNTFPGHALDGNLKTSWASEWSNSPQHITVDLGTSKRISGTRLIWEFASAGTIYDLQVSENPGGPWNSVYSTSNGDGGVDIIKNLNVAARYVRLNITKGTLGTYVLKEMEVYSSEMECNSMVTSLFDGNVKGNNRVRLYPNPAQNYLKIELEDFEYTKGTPVEVSVYDHKSTLQWRKTMNDLSNEIDISHLAAGSYVLNIKFGKKQYSQQFMVNKH